MTSGSENNTLVGQNAGTAINTGDKNVCMGYNAGASLQAGYRNVVIGNIAGDATNFTTSTIVGYDAAGSSPSSFEYSAFFGYGAGSNSTSSYSVYLGRSAGRRHSGNSNVIIGDNSGNIYGTYGQITGANNVILGAAAGGAVTSAGSNTIIGYDAGDALTTGSNNIILGNQAAASAVTVSNEITLGNDNITKFRVPGINVVLKDNGGTPTQGHVLTVDANGEASFAAASGGTDVGITTNLSGSFTASAGSPSTINTFGYGSGDIVVEYTVFIKNGSNFQSQKLLAMRDGTTIHSSQFAVMYSSSLLVQLDATISSGNILLRATPETGVSGSTTYKIKREVM